MANQQWKAGEKEAVMQLMCGISAAQLTSSVFSNYLCMDLHALNVSYQEGKKGTQRGLEHETSIVVLVEIQETRRC